MTTATEAELVNVDHIGTPPPPQTLDAARLCVVGVPESVRQRLVAAGAQVLVEDADITGGSAEDAALVVVSTRVPRAELAGRVKAVRAVLDAPVVVLAHTGGEGLAVEVMRLGAVGVLAEGNEAALASFLSGQAYDTSLVDTYDRQLSHGLASEDAARSRDDVTGLPRASAFDQRLATLAQAGEVPRVGFLRVLHLEHAALRLSAAATALLLRRLAMRYREAVRGTDVELFTLSPSDFALVGDLSPQQTESLARRLAAATEMFSPTGSQALALAVGHAGPEVTTELGALREMAHRALSVAATQTVSSVVGAEALALGVSSTTELEAAIRLIDFVEQHDGHAPGHGARVASAADELLAELGYDAAPRARIRLAGYLHDIGKAGLPAEALAGGEELTGDLLLAYRSHPIRSADYLRVSSGDEVADAVRSHHERWDGAGFPDGLAGDAIPLAARVLAVVDRYDDLRHGPEGLSAARAAAQLDEEAGTRLDPAIVRAALPVLARLETLRAITP